VVDVPLIAVFPDSSLAGGALDRPVSLLDVLPTVHDYIGLPIDGQVRGRSLLRQFAGHPQPADRWFFADLKSAPWFGDDVLQSVTHERQLLIVTRPDSEELYDLTRDPRAQRDLSERREAVVDTLWSEYEEQRSHWELARRAQTDTDLSAEEIRKLRSLGYVQ
jgi:arylsulfatase A-like enzyme